MALLGKADWLLRIVTSWPAIYFAFLFSFITHAITSIIKAAFLYYPPSNSPQKPHEQKRKWESGEVEEEGEVEEVLEMKDQSLANGEKEKEDTPVVTRAGRQVRNHKNSSKRSLVLSSNTLFTS